jgi:hypothetical protein
MTFATTNSTPGNGVLSCLPLIPGAADPAVQQLVGDLARLATEDPASAAKVVRDILSSAPSSTSAEIATAIAANLDDHALEALTRTPAGRGLLEVLDQQGQIDRFRDAQSAMAADKEGLQASMQRVFGGQYDIHVAAQFRLVDQAIRPRLLNAAASGKNVANGDAAAKEQVKSAFKEEFANKAADKEGFDAFMQQVYGDKYDKNLAEQYRQCALRGDFSWLPDVKFVDAATLHGGNGAYNAQEGVVYINRDVAAADPQKAAQVFVEEAGAHLDAKLNTADTQGDEGEMFRRVLSGENLSQQEIAAIRNDDDHGTITVDGKKVEVEFWFGEDIVDAASDAVDTVADAASDAVDYVGDAARDVVYEVGDAVKEAGMGLINSAEMIMQGVFVDVIGGTFMNLIHGRVADAWDSIIRGLDKAVIQAPRRLLNGWLEGAGHMLKTFTHVLPDKVGGNLLREVVDRGIDSVRTIANGVIDIARNFYRLPFEVVVGFGKDIGEAMKHWARGDIGGGFERFGMAFVNPFKRVGGAVVDSVMIAGQGVGNVFGNVFGLHEPSRGLSKEEREYLKSVYGDSINLEDIRIHRGNLTHGLGMAPHCVGDDIYLPDSGKDNCFNPDGSLNEKGKLTLVHEAFHVYQAQKGGNDYIHEALLWQAGDRKTAYNWTAAMREGKPFSEWNPEQQAEFFETVARAKYGHWGKDNNGDGVPDKSYDLNQDGKIDKNELELAWTDIDGDGKPGMDTDGDGVPDNGAGGRDYTTQLTDQEFKDMMIIWDTVKADRPDRTVV